MHLPRIMLAAVASGSGKTTITCGILQALMNKDITPVASKCGPDYIDPMFHGKVLGVNTNNLDAFFCADADIRNLLGKHAQHGDVAIIEGVMGYYDGYALSTDKGSSYDIARITQTPVILVVACKGMGLSVVPLIKGMIEFRKDSNIKGIILNGIGKVLYEKLKEIIEQELPLKVCGYMPKLDEVQIESRHLGLVTPQEIQHIKVQLELLGHQTVESVDLEGIMEIASNAPELEVHTILEVETRLNNKEILLKAKPRIGIALDKAFCFYYKDNLELLESLGCELVYFSPLHDSQLPPDLQGIIFGGGYPELYAKELEENKAMRQAVYQKLQSGIYCLAECGGFMYLQDEMEGSDGKSYQMIGYLKGTSYKTEKLVRFGYLKLTAREDNFLQNKGETIKGHEFHYWNSTDNGAAYIGEKPVGNRSWNCCHVTNHIFAGYPHIHYYSNPSFAERFVECCRNRRAL